MTFEESLNKFRNLVEAYDPKREPDEDTKYWNAKKAQWLEKLKGREHKSGHTVKPIRQYLLGKIEGQKPGRGKRGGLGGGGDLAPSWAKRDKKAYTHFERQTAKKDIEKELEPEQNMGLRQGLSKDRPSGFFGKTAKDNATHMKARNVPEREVMFWKGVDKKNKGLLPGGTRSGPKKTDYTTGTKVSPHPIELEKRKEDPAEAAKAKQAQADAISRYKTLKKLRKAKPDA